MRATSVALIQRKHMLHERQRYIQAMQEKGIPVPEIADGNIARSVKKVLAVIRPYMVEGISKVRIGGECDGGYVMADPGRGGIAYSFGVSDYSPWDLAMAEKGFRVFQYDGTIDQEPDKHPNIIFNKYNVSAVPSGDVPSKTLREILRENGHHDERDIILQMDIEGSEWDFFETASREDMLRFKQILVEFHETGIWLHRYTVLRKILETHIPIHVHYNNAANAVAFAGDSMVYCDKLVEVSYVRADGLAATACPEYYPTKLDSPNLSKRPEIPIGYFDVLLEGETPPS